MWLENTWNLVDIAVRCAQCVPHFLADLGSRRLPTVFRMIGEQTMKEVLPLALAFLFAARLAGASQEDFFGPAGFRM